MALQTADAVSTPPVRSGSVGPLGRLGGWAADHLRAVALTWAAVAIVLAAFAPQVESALSGAGWQANGSESVAARTLIQQNFAGLSSSAPMVVLHSSTLSAGEPPFRRVLAQVEGVLRADPRIASIVPPQAGASISPDGRTAIVVAGARGDPTAMVAAADTLTAVVERAGRPSYRR